MLHAGSSDARRHDHQIVIGKWKRSIRLEFKNAFGDKQKKIKQHRVEIFLVGAQVTAGHHLVPGLRRVGHKRKAERVTRGLQVQTPEPLTNHQGASPFMDERCEKIVKEQAFIRLSRTSGLWA